MALLPARNILDGSSLPVTSQMKTALGSLRDYCSDLLGTDSGNKAAARTALGAAASGANADITSLTGLTTPLSMALGGTGMANGFVSSKAASGYQKLPSGLIIQWVSSGLVSCAAATSTPISATLPIAFPTAALFAFANLKDIGVAGANTGPWGASSTLSAVSASVNMQSAQSVSLGFLVIGY